MRFKVEFLQKFKILVGFGGLSSDRFGINRCKKKGVLKNRGARRFGPEAVAP